MKIQKESASASPNYDVPALDKGLDILECLAAGRRPLMQSELSRYLDRTPSEIFRMLNCLERRGYISKDADSGAYALTLRLFELSHTHSPYQQLLRLAQRPMRQLADIIGETCHVGVLHHGELLILAQEHACQRLRMSIEVGSLSPALQTGSGRLLLAYLDENTRQQVLRDNAEFQSMTGPKQREVLARLAATLDRGYEVAPSELVEGITDLAVPIGNPGAILQATVAVALMPRKGGPSVKNLVQLALPPMYECAAAIGLSAGLLMPGRDGA